VLVGLIPVLAWLPAGLAFKSVSFLPIGLASVVALATCGMSKCWLRVTRTWSLLSQVAPVRRPWFVWLGKPEFLCAS
jgi:hypothetical protein